MPSSGAGARSPPALTRDSFLFLAGVFWSLNTTGDSKFPVVSNKVGCEIALSDTETSAPKGRQKQEKSYTPSRVSEHAERVPDNLRLPLEGAAWWRGG